MSETSFYKENLPKLIQRLKKSLDKIAPIIDQDIDKDIRDDKLTNVLKAKRQAAEDYLWTIKEVDRLEAELNGKKQEELEKKQSVHPSKQFSRS